MYARITQGTLSEAMVAVGPAVTLAGAM